MRRSKIYFLILTILFLACLLPGRAHADAAPPAVPDGENILPGEEFTMVQMVAEEVIIDVGSTLKTMYNQWNDDYQEGFVTSYNCTFWMVNQGEETENLAVRFPISSNYSHYTYGEIDIQSIKINGNAVPWIEDAREIPIDYGWAHFDVTFPPGEEVEIQVTYTTITEAWSPRANQSVNYILETGAGWYGPIGQGRIILRMPYKVTPDNIMMSEDKNSPMGEMTDYDMVWEFTDLEPTEKDNFEIKIVSPEVWLEILAAREKLEKSPNNSSALFRLATNIETATILKGGRIHSQSLYEEGYQAIQKAVNIDPDNIDYHDLYLHYMVPGYFYHSKPLETAQVIYEEASTAFALNPEESWYREIIYTASGEISAMQTGTARPTATETVKTPTPLPSATSTEIMPTPTATLTPPPIPVQKEPTPTTMEIISYPPRHSTFTYIAIGALILVVGSAVWLIQSRKSPPTS